MEEKGLQFRNAFIEVGEICFYRLARPYIKDWMMKYLPLGQRQKKLWEILEDFAGKVIEDRRKYHASIGHNVFKQYFDRVENGMVQDDERVQKKNLSVLDILLLNE
ncbi:uncharacterized protein LOC131669052 [Phymastichus coffea]|uniref:uncharacterized protein LOC131669052 n=1 Tax=Phymastichus coffea TaxID=108790 RepID=UPI00273B3177|nr:uncharacterized protein LOC131669052 [Phymastichus coffea]